MKDGDSMQIFDITRELFSAPLYPGDPKPEAETIYDMENGDDCNLSVLHTCLHNGTHLDAPLHYCADGQDVSALPPEDFVGECNVVEWDGYLTGADIENILPSLRERVLFKGNVQITPSAAFVLSDCQVKLVGVESMTVEPNGSDGVVHRQLLGNGVTVLEGLDLSQVQAGVYLLIAAPLKMAGADGSPVRAMLLPRKSQ